MGQDDETVYPYNVSVFKRGTIVIHEQLSVVLYLMLT